MKHDQLNIFEVPRIRNSRMIVGLSGWMDGGEVSTGTLEFLIQKLGAWKCAEIDAEDFYIYNFPGTMEVASLFRPTALISDGFIRKYEQPENTFFADEENNIILFLGKEPNLHWKAFADCIFSFAQQVDVKAIYFIGSVAGLVPHTRQPRISCSVSDTKTKAALKQYGLRFSDYRGPAGISTYLTWLARKRGISFATFVAEIPAYVEGRNPKCIDTVVKLLSAILELHIDLEDLLDLSDELEHRLNELVQERTELVELIKKLEQDYDNEIFDTEMGDLKSWLEQRGLRLD
jgi:predicted ATP-grasp superfamily ATP-dependent carboligase